MNQADKETDRVLLELEKKISKEYKKAEHEVTEKLNDYLRRFAKKDERWREWVENGVKTQAEYTQWKTGQIAIGKRWQALRDSLAHSYMNADKVARSMMEDARPQVFALNLNYATYEVEHGLKVDTSYVLYDADTVTNLMTETEDIYHTPGKEVSKQIAEGKILRWNNEVVQSVMMQSIIQGEAIPTIATRLAETVAEHNRKAAIRNARTMVTGAQNAGRVRGYQRAEAMGIKLKQQWLATLDTRTRHSHRMLDGETVQVGKKFSNGCRFPGDPEGLPKEIYNCRCTLIAALEGFEHDLSDLSLRKDEKLGKMTYNQWKESKLETSNPLTRPEEVAAEMKRMYNISYATNGNVFNYHTNRI